MKTEELDRCAKKIWDYMLMHQELRPMDAIFVLGSNDLSVPKYAAELFLQGYARYVICSGGFGKDARFERPEAEVFADILYESGVPKENVILETMATNTGENIRFTKELIESRGLGFKSFILVQKPYMERRTYAAFRKQRPEADCIVTSPSVSYEEYAKDNESRDRFVNVMVGDLQRIREYPKYGFQIEQEIPEDVWAAWEQLIAMGYTKYYLPESL